MPEGTGRPTHHALSNQCEGIEFNWRSLEEQSQEQCRNLAVYDAAKAHARGLMLLTDGAVPWTQASPARRTTSKRVGGASSGVQEEQ